jgi:hypothetical protein
MRSQAFAIFCDDIRQEVTGKRMLIGVYGTDLVVPQFPVTLPQLCVETAIRVPREDRLEALSMNIYLNATLVGRAELTSDFLADFYARAVDLPAPLDLPRPDGELPEPTMRAQMTAVLRNIECTGPAVLRVHVQAGSDVLRAGALSIRDVTEAERASLGVQAPTSS